MNGSKRKQFSEDRDDIMERIAEVVGVSINNGDKRPIVL